MSEGQPAAGRITTAPVIELKPRGSLLFDDEIEQIPDPAPLVEGVLDLNSTAMLYGETGAGKSFVALDWALCVASGQAWHDHVVAAPGKVLYVVGEGLSGTRARVLAWKRHHKRAALTGLAWADHAPNILTPAGRQELYGWVDTFQPVLIILDTLARHIAGGDENAFEIMSQAVEVLDTLRLMTGGCALAVHHTGKDTHAGARGHSSLKGAMDTEIACIKDHKGPKLTVTKQKNHEDGHVLATFNWKKVTDSLVLDLSTSSAHKNHDIALSVLAAAQVPLDYVTWRDRSVVAGIPAGSFDRVRRALIGKAMVVTDGTDGDGGKNHHRLP